MGQLRRGRSARDHPVRGHLPRDRRERRLAAGDFRSDALRLQDGPTQNAQRRRVRLLRRELPMTTTQSTIARSGCSRNLPLRMLAVVLAAFGLLLSFTPALAQNNCIDDVTGRVNNCTANDIRVGFGIVTDNPVPICTPNAQIMIHVRWRLTSGPDRYDVGLFVAKDGGTARSGVCTHDYLPPPLAPSVGSCTPGTVDPNSGSGPYWNGECAVTPNDACGDIQGGVDTYRDDVVLITCKDTNGDNKTDVGTCVSWEKTKGSTPVCLGVNDTKPSTPAKCDCEQITIDNLCFKTPEVCDGI